ncbi:MAG: DUF1080 domain-containing protein [Ginsengibacter sp.]
MKFIGIINVKKACILLNICLLSFIDPASAGTHGPTGFNALVYDKIVAFRNMDYRGSCWFNHDTIPKHHRQEKSEDWEVLFDGKNTGKFRGVNSDTFPSNAWEIEGGTLFVKNHAKGADIITREEYSNFELFFDFKLTRTANSGIKYFVAEIKNNSTGTMMWGGPEYQIIDDYNHPAVKDHKDEKGSTAALYLLYAPENKKLLPAGQWNTAKIIAEGNHVEHWLNSVKVVSYERGTGEFRRRMATTKFKDYDNYGELSGGHIMITDHDGDKVYFRNIRIKPLK